MVCEYCGNDEAKMFCDSDCAASHLTILKMMEKIGAFLTDRDWKMFGLLKELKPRQSSRCY